MTTGEQINPREAEAAKMRINQIKKLGTMEGVSFENLNPHFPFRHNTEILRNYVQNPECDKRPSIDRIQELVTKWSRFPHHYEDEYWSGTLESIVTDLIRACANDIDSTLELPEEFEPGKAGGYLFEAYRGWTLEDFKQLFEKLSPHLLNPIPDLDFELLRKQSIEKQEQLDYDEERDIEVIQDFTVSVVYRGYAFERLFKKIKAEPEYLEEVQQKFAPSPVEKNDTYTPEINAYNKKLLDFIEERIAA